MTQLSWYWEDFFWLLWRVCSLVSSITVTSLDCPSVDRKSNRRRSAFRGLGAQHRDLWHHQWDGRGVGIMLFPVLSYFWSLSLQWSRRASGDWDCPVLDLSVQVSIMITGERGKSRPPSTVSWSGAHCPTFLMSYYTVLQFYLYSYILFFGAGFYYYIKDHFLWFFSHLVCDAMKNVTVSLKCCCCNYRRCLQ